MIRSENFLWLLRFCNGREYSFMLNKFSFGLLSKRYLSLMAACSHLRFVVALLVAFFYTGANAAPATPQGAFVPVPLPLSALNADIRTWSDGGRYNGFMSGSQNFNGVPFQMQTNGSGNNVIWATSTNVSNIGSGTYSNTVTIPTSTYGTLSVYALINTAYGSSSGSTNGSLTFSADDGTSYSVSLVLGNNVRDHYYGSIPSASYVTSAVVGINTGAHLDMQRFDLPASFANKRLISITFTSSGNTNKGLPFLAGLTLDASINLIGNYTMEEQTPWSGVANELKDSASFSGGPFNGQAIGSPIPVQAFTNPARAGTTNGTCQYAQLGGPSNNGGAFQLNNLPVYTAPYAQNSLSFWVYWNGSEISVPLGWTAYKLIFKNGLFGFDPSDGRIYGTSSSGLSNGWHHVAAVFTNLDITQNQLYIDGVLQSLSLSGTQTPISFFNPDSISTNVSPPATWGTGQPPAGWYTDNPSKIIEVNPPSVYGATGATSNNAIEIEANPGDYNLYTILNPDPGEKLTLNLAYAGRVGHMSGTDSEIDVYLNNVLFTRLNTQSSTFQNFSFSMGIATGSPIKLEFRSVDTNSYGGLLTNIQVLEIVQLPLLP